MIEKIKKALKETYNLDESKGIFLSGFDANGTLLFSNGLLMTDKSMNKIIDDLYYGFADKNKKGMKVLICDVITVVNEITTYENIFQISPKEYGFAMVSIESNLSGVILPDTVGVADAKNAFALIKNKYGLSGKVRVYSFQTHRVTLEL